MKVKRFLSLLLCLSIILTLLPTTSPPASAAGASSMMLGASGISGAGSNWIYFGEDSSSPVRWRVLAETGGNKGTYTDSSGTSVDSGDAMFLMSEYMFLMSKADWKAAAIAFDSDGVANEGQTSAKDWQVSNAQAWCSDRYTDTSNFTSLEKGAITATTKTDPTSSSYNACSLSAEHLFFLSYFEVTNASYGFTDSSARLCKVSESNATDVSWLLRTAFSSLDCIGMVGWSGTADGAAPIKDSYFTRPALNLNRNSILFSSAAAGGKSSGTVGAGALTAVSPTIPTEWKLTLLDSNRNFTVFSRTIHYQAKTLTIEYNGATVGENEYVSAVIVDSGNNIKYYGRIGKPANATGTATIDISNLSMGDSICVFSEQYHGDYKTDYASALLPISTIVKYAISDLGCSDTYAHYGTDYSGYIGGLPGYLLPSSISVTVAGTPATLTGSATDADTAGEYYYNTSTGEIKVAKVNGAVVITAAGVAKTYTISASPTNLDFGSMTDGYTTAPDAQTVTITNNGISAITGYSITGGGTDYNATYTSAPISAGGTSTFTVKPSAGLSAGIHAKTLTIQTSEGSTATVNISFTVQSKPSGGGYSPVYYTISATTGKDGSISPSGSTSVESGNDMTYTITADKGFKIEDVLVDGVSVGAISAYTFKNVNSAHTISASFKKAETLNSFSDVDKNDWFYDNVMYVYKNGLMTGTGSDTFSPKGTTTRAMIVTVLYRLSGDKGSYSNAFSDILSGSWYETAASWAAANGITSGVGGNQFAPDKSMTREQLAVMLYNYAKYKGLNVSIGENTNILSYNDAASISDYAYTALQWACGSGIINGDGGGNLKPQSSATRAEVAAMLQRFIKSIVDCGGKLTVVSDTIIWVGKVGRNHAK